MAPTQTTQTSAREFALTVLRFAHDLHERHPEWCGIHAIGVPSQDGTTLPAWTATIAELAQCRLEPLASPRHLIDEVLARRWPFDAADLPASLEAEEEQEIRTILEKEIERVQSAEVLEGVTEHHLPAAEGEGLPYLRCGEGPPQTIFWNALGQGTAMYHPLLSCWPKGESWATWRTRDPNGGDIPSFEQHEQDFLTLMEATGAEKVDIVAWCTAGKASLRFAARYPEKVNRIVLLQPAFRSNDLRLEWQTNWEADMKVLVSTVLGNARVAPIMSTSLRQLREQDSWPVEQLRDKTVEAAAAVWDMIPISATKIVRGTWADGQTTIDYLGQLDDFWKEDVAPWLPKVQAPVLMLSSERDPVSSHEYAAWVKDQMPHAEQVILRDANHYAVFEAPLLAADQTLAFFKSSHGECS